MLGWLAILVTFSLIILVHEMGHFFAARRFGVKVERFSLGFGPKIFGLRRRGTEYCLCLLPIGGYVKMAGETTDLKTSPKPWEYRAKHVWQRFLIVFAGPMTNYLFAWVLFTGIFVIGAPLISISNEPKVGQVVGEYPAAAAGVRPGDKIVSVNGEKVETWTQVTDLIHRQSSLMTLEIEREGVGQTYRITPRLEEVTDPDGKKMRIGMIGIAPAQIIETVRYPIFRAFGEAAQQIWKVTAMTTQSLWYLAVGRLSVKETLTGPIGIFFITSSVATAGWIYLLQLIAMLSTALGFFNFLPIPVLDGGHLAFLAAEKLRGRPVSQKAQEVMSWMGLAAIMTLLVTVSYNDFLKYKVTDRVAGFFGREQ